jgi:hypothetical protein
MGTVVVRTVRIADRMAAVGPAAERVAVAGVESKIVVGIGIVVTPGIAALLESG